MTIKNPILRGFHPDPSIVRVGEDFYIATSTFQWFPGVQIHHSRDLVHWRLLTRPLDRVSQLDLRGDPNSGGVWAPCLSHDGTLFYLVYTDVKSLHSPYLETHNYLVTSPDILGPWSEPTPLNNSGFDPSLFHDDNGRKWLVNMRVNPRREKDFFDGIELTEWDPATGRLVSPARMIFPGTAAGITEGPHLYKRKGYYYLVTAEGGTGSSHCVTVARSRDLHGPYQPHPENPILTSRGKPHLRLQKSGHASLVELADGSWYLAHLCARPLAESNRCMLGRETALQRIVWDEDGWMRLASGNNEPETTVPAPNLPACPWDRPPARDDFDTDKLPLHFQSLRVPLDESMCSLTERPGFLRLKGRDGLGSHFDQSLVARRLQAFEASIATSVDFQPATYEQSAGLICYYDSMNYHYLRLIGDEEKGPLINILTCDRGRFTDLRAGDVPIGRVRPVFLFAEINHETIQFFYGQSEEERVPVGPVLDGTILSDEHADWGFTGCFVGLCCQDKSGQGYAADFDFFSYKEIEETK